MKKTERLIQKCLPLVDAVVEIFDARIAVSSRNPELKRLISSKPQIVVLNKSDMADENISINWLKFFKHKGITAVLTDCTSGKGVGSVIPAVKSVLREKLERNEAKGMAGKNIHIMIVGIPNVGKSTLINRLAGKKKANVEDRPGVTRDKQWIRISDECELLDIPGMLWPKFEDPIVGERLSFTGAVKDDVIDIETLAARLLETLIPSYSININERYKIDINSMIFGDHPGFDILEIIAKKRGFLIQGGEADIRRAAIMILDEYRAGKLGRISLEAPQMEVT
jgi:ribosome biogenesis GTPase A